MLRRWRYQQPNSNSCISPLSRSPFLKPPSATTTASTVTAILLTALFTISFTLVYSPSFPSPFLPLVTMLLRFALFACLVALLRASGASADCQSANCVPQVPYTFCYKFKSLPAGSSLDAPYSVAVLLSGEVASFGIISDATATTPAGQYATILSGSGSFTILNRYNKTLTYPISSLSYLPGGSPDTYARFYVSNTSFPQFVDANGLILNLDSTYEFPGKQYSSQFNLTRPGVYGVVTQSGISGLDPTSFSLTANAGSFWTGPQYVPGSCVPALHANELIPVKPAVARYSVSVRYNYSGSTLGGWRVSTYVAFQTDGGVYGPDGLGDYWLQLDTSLVAANGSGTRLGLRQYYLTGSLLYQSNISAASTPSTVVKQNQVSAVDNRVYLYPPYIDYAGWGYNFFYLQPIPGMGGILYNRNFSSVNLYVNQAGVLSEAFPNSTQPNFDGGVNPRATTLSVSFAQM